MRVLVFYLLSSDLCEQYSPDTSPFIYYTLSDWGQRVVVCGLLVRSLDESGVTEDLGLLDRTIGLHLVDRFTL